MIASPFFSYSQLFHVIPCITGFLRGGDYPRRPSSKYRPGLLLFKNPAREDTAETIERLRSGDVRSVSGRLLGAGGSGNEKGPMLRLVKFRTKRVQKRGPLMVKKYGIVQLFWFNFIFWWFNSGEPQKEPFPLFAPAVSIWELDQGKVYGKAPSRHGHHGSIYNGFQMFSW